MAAPEFAIDLNLDGHSYAAARDASGGRSVAVSYIPKVRSTRVNAVGEATLDPIEYTSFHRGAGASRNLGIPDMLAYAENMWTCDPGVLLPGPEITSAALPGAITNQAPRPDGIAEADGHILVGAGQHVFRLTAGQATAPTPSIDLDLSSGHQAQSLRRFGSSIFLSQTGGSGALYERPDGGAWTQALLGTLTVAPTGALGRVWWNASGVVAERLIAQFGPRDVRYCATSPRLDTNWTPGLANPAIDVGGVGTITRFSTTLTHLYIATTGGLLDLDASGLAPNLVPEAEIMVSQTGGLATMAADGLLYYSSGYQIYRVQVTGQSYARVEAITPFVRMPNETPVGGYGTALIKRADFLIYAMYDPLNDVSWVCWGREANQNEAQPYVWNVAPIVLRGFKVTALHASTLASDGPRLWMFGQTLDGAVSAKWAPLAFTTPYSDLRGGRARRFSQTSYVVLPAEDGGDDSIPKDVEEVLNENEDMIAGNQIAFSARRDGEIAFTQLAKFTNGPRATVPIRTAFVSQRPTFRIDMSGSSITPPILRRLSVRWLPNPDLREVRRYILKLGRSEQYGGGSWQLVGAEDDLRRLVTLATSAARVALIDEANHALMVRVLKVEGPTEYESTERNDRALAVAISISIFGALPLPSFVWDSGATYDELHSWST